VGTLQALSAAPTVHGILFQHPMGARIDERAAFEAIAPEKDVATLPEQTVDAAARRLGVRVSATRRCTA
jgi:5,10-methylene-tetrahydrofolate dehydrogenase/methenyl tetrahydrofolate cyclohydrolase